MNSSPINWSILDNESMTRMSLHNLDKEIDGGGLVVEHPCRIYDTYVSYSLGI